MTLNDGIVSLVRLISQNEHIRTADSSSKSFSNQKAEQSSGTTKHIRGKVFFTVGIGVLYVYVVKLVK